MALSRTDFMSQMLPKIDLYLQLEIDICYSVRVLCFLLGGTKFNVRVDI